MSLIWPASEADVVTGAPRLHALVIGVGDYPHLNGGSSKDLAADPLGLNQITTPRFTAPAIATWLKDSYKNSACEIGSLEVVISPSAPALTTAGAPVAEAATMANVKAAVTRWFKRCTTQANNIAFFYFCGHGLAKVDQYLLPEDFGDPGPLDRWQNCIDFGGLRSGMGLCKAQTQLFFVDACRETPFALLSQLKVKGDPIITGETVDDTVSCSAVFYAAGQGRQAFGPDDDITYFGRAVLACLKGVAAEKKKGSKWVVSTGNLGKVLLETMAVLAKRYRLPLTCDPQPMALARINEPPTGMALAALECTSEDANNAAEIRLENGAHTFKSLPGEPKPLVQEVEIGTWTITVTFPGGGFPSLGPAPFELRPGVFDELEVP